MADLLKSAEDVRRRSAVGAGMFPELMPRVQLIVDRIQDHLEHGPPLKPGERKIIEEGLEIGKAALAKGRIGGWHYLELNFRLALLNARRHQPRLGPINLVASYREFALELQKARKGASEFGHVSLTTHRGMEIEDLNRGLADGAIQVEAPEVPKSYDALKVEDRDALPDKLMIHDLEHYTNEVLRTYRHLKKAGLDPGKFLRGLLERVESVQDPALKRRMHAMFLTITREPTGFEFQMGSGAVTKQFRFETEFLKLTLRDNGIASGTEEELMRDIGAFDKLWNQAWVAARRPGG